MIRKKEGFPGEVSIVIPVSSIREIKKNPLISALYITDMGYYPRARNHYRERPEGCPQNILIYSPDGYGEIELNGKSFRIEPNHFFVIPANMSHRYRADKQDPWSIYWLHFEGQKSKYFSQYFGRINPISPSPISRIDDRIELFSEILYVLEMGFSRENLEYAKMCLWHILASFMYINQFRSIRQGAQPDLITASIQYMRSNLQKPLSLNDLASQSKYSITHFSKLFSEKTGYSPMDYFNQLRIQEACKHLDFSKATIYEVAEIMGFSDQFYFSRVFKKTMGISPSEYRKRNKKW